MDSETMNIWTPILSALAMAVVACVSTVLNRLVKSKREKKADKKAVAEAEIEMEQREMEVERTRADRAWSRQKVLEDRIDHLVVAIDKIRDELIKAKLEVINERNLRIIAEQECTTLRRKLNRLIDCILNKCPDFDVSPFKDEKN